MAFVLKRIIASSATISRSAVAVPFRRSSAVDTNQRRPLFSDVFSRFSSSSATKGPLPHTILPPQHEVEQQVPKVVSPDEALKLFHPYIKSNKKEESNKVDTESIYVMTNECVNLLLAFAIVLRPELVQYAVAMAALKGVAYTALRRNSNENQNQLQLPQKKELAVYRSTCDKAGLKVFVQVHGLGKQDLTVLIFDDLLLVTSNVILPSGKKMKEFIKLPMEFDYDPNEITADIVEGGELMIYIPFGKKNEDAMEPTVFQLKLN